MLKQRVVETNEGIQGEIETKDFDALARRMRDRGWMETAQIIACGITAGHVLEIGPGPGYLGLEWLKRAGGGSLIGLEISENMISIALRNAAEYGIEDRVEYVQGNALAMPFADGMFDAVMSSGSLHEWEDPVRVFDEAYRVLKKDGQLYVSDMKRNTRLPIRWMMKMGVKTPSMKAGMISSMNAAYTAGEMAVMMEKTVFGSAVVKTDAFGLSLYCEKRG